MHQYLHSLLVTLRMCEYIIYSNSNYVVRHSCSVASIDLQVKAILVCEYFVPRKKNQRKIFLTPFGLGILTVISHVALKMIF